MAQFRHFAATAKHDPLRCEWCGKKLRRHRYRPGERGDYGDGFFCGLRCGYLFGVAIRETGTRFSPPSEVNG